MKTALYSLFAILFLLPTSSYAQEQNTTKEIGLYTNTLDSYGLIYKFGKENLRYRISFVSINGAETNYDENYGNTKSKNEFGFGTRFGIEKPIPINESFNFYYGTELGASYQKSKIEDQTGESVTRKYQVYSLSFVLGASVRLAERVKLSAEMLPQFSYTKNKVPDDNYDIFQFRLRNTYSYLTLSYLF